MSIVYETDPSLDALFLGDDHGVDLRVRKSQIPGAGLGLVSMGQIRQGEDIFWKEQFCVVSDNHLPVTCDNCLQWMGSSIDANGRMCGIGDSGLEVKSCAGCKVVRYCTKACQKRAWRLYHKQECRLLAGRKLPLVARALVRLLIRRANGSLGDQQWRAIQKLESHSSFYRQTPASWDDVVSASMTTRELLKLERSSVEEIQHLYCQIWLNCIGLELLEFENIGIALDPLASLLNHSCTPNAICLFDGTTLRVRSLEPISPGQEILMSYTDNTMDYDLRRRMLESKWFFTCTCVKCQGESRNASRAGISYDTGIRSRLMSVDGIDLLRTPEEGVSVISAICRSMPWGEVWPTHAQPMPHLQFKIARGYLANENWIEALRHLLNVCFMSDPILYSRTNPRRVARLYMLLLVLWKVQGKVWGSLTQHKLGSVGLGFVFKHFLLRLMEDAPKSHGQHSKLAKAIRYRYEDEECLMNTVQGTESEEQVQLSDFMKAAEGITKQELNKLLDWADVPGTPAW